MLMPSEHASDAGQSTKRSVRESWLIVCAQVLLVVGGFFLLWPSAVSLFTEWENTDNTTYTHGYLIAAISLWLLFRNRERLRHCPFVLNIPAAVALCVVSVVWLIALRAGIQVAHQLLLPILLWLAIFAAMGARVAFISAFAIGYLMFSIPVWGLINEVLQTLTTKAVDLMLRTTAVNAFVDGNIVHLASGTFEIAGGCSGLHFFIVALALAALYGEVNSDTRRVRLQLLALATGLAILTNWVRVYTIIVAGYLTDMQHYLVRVDHYKFGWVVFAVMMTVFFVIARRFPTAPMREASAQPSTAEISVAQLSRGVALALLVLAIGPLWNIFAPARAAQLPEGSVLPKNPGAWSGPMTVEGGDWNPSFKGADRTEQGHYAGFGQSVQIYSAMYASQAQNKELISYHNSIIGDERARTISISRISPRRPRIEMVVESGSGTAVIWYFYRVGSLRTDRSSFAQLWYGIASLASEPVSQIVALRARCAADCEAARSALSNLVATVDPAQSTP